MTFSTLKFTVADGVAQIVFARPEKRNAFNLQMRDELLQALDTCAVDSTLHAVLLRGQGASFCAGADLTEFETYPSPFEARQIRFDRDVWGLLSSLPVPLVVCAQGSVAGSGVEMFALGDVRIAEPGALFVMPESRLGLVSTTCGTQTLPRLVGGQPASQLLLGLCSWDARQAFAHGLAHRVVAADELQAEGRRVCASFGSIDKHVLGHLVQSVRSARNLQAHPARQIEARRAALVMNPEEPL